MSSVVVFLDIDGVLNSGTWFEQLDEERWDDLDYFDPVCVERVDRICRETGASVVISSSWRKSRTLDEITSLLQRRGFTGNVIGITPTLGVGISGIRGKEILRWVRENGPCKFVAIDDYRLPEVARRQIHTNPTVGLTELQTAKAIKMLK